MDDYRFVMADYKVIAQENIKKHTAITKQLWCLFRDAGYVFFGATRDWSAVMGIGSHYWAIHHFIDEKPEPLMMDESTGLRWHNMFPEEEVIFQALNHLDHSGFQIMIPEQCFIDAAFEEVLYGEAGWHLHSPKHKLGIWAVSDIQSFLFEYYPNKPFAPYGLKEAMEWPFLDMVEYEQISFFDDIPSAGRRRANKSLPAAHSDEQFIIDDEVPEEIEAITDRAIERLFNEQEILIVAFSGGKDSYVLLLKCIQYKLSHPECKTELHIVSADTGVENPLIKEHVRNVQRAVWTLPVHIPFAIVEPALEERFYVCLFGKNYAPPSQSFKWCVDRIKGKRQIQHTWKQNQIHENMKAGIPRASEDRYEPTCMECQIAPPPSGEMRAVRILSREDATDER